MNANLSAVIRLKTMAAAAASGSEHPGSDEGSEMANAYMRLRDEAIKLCVRAGWGSSSEDVAQELPPLEGWPMLESSHDRGRMDAHEAYVAVGAGLRARVLLGQLSAWAAGYQETFEVEARLQASADAAARVAAEASKPKVGF